MRSFFPVSLMLKRNYTVRETCAHTAHKADRVRYRTTSRRIESKIERANSEWEAAIRARTDVNTKYIQYTIEWTRCDTAVFGKCPSNETNWRNHEKSACFFRWLFCWLVLRVINIILSQSLVVAECFKYSDIQLINMRMWQCDSATPFFMDEWMMFCYHFFVYELTRMCH